MPKRTYITSTPIFITATSEEEAQQKFDTFVRNFNHGAMDNNPSMQDIELMEDNSSLELLNDIENAQGKKAT